MSLKIPIDCIFGLGVSFGKKLHHLQYLVTFLCSVIYVNAAGYEAFIFSFSFEETINPPQNLTINGWNDYIIVNWRKENLFNPVCFKSHLQHKSKEDDDWQNITGNNMYSVTIPKSDNEMCHVFRVRMKWNDVCDSGSDWSKWSPLVIWRNGSVLDSCHDNPTKNERILSSTNSNAPFLIIVLMAAIAMLLYCTYKTKRLRQVLIPEIPDPKHVFDDLFSYYDGNVQVWLDAFEASNGEFKPVECKHICIVEVEPEQEQEVEETMINFASVNQISCEISHVNTAETSVVSDNPKTEEKANFELNECNTSKTS